MAFSIKSRHERYKVRDDVVEITEPDKASLVSLFFNYMSVLIRKTWTMQVQALLKIQRAKIAAKKYIQKTNNNPKQSGSETKPLRGRLQPNRRLERDLFRKGGTTA